MSLVLIVSDDFELRQMLFSMLSPTYPLALPEAVPGLRALDEIRRTKPRLVIIQMELRYRDGLSLANEILATQDAGVVIVARSGALAARAFDIGVDDFLVMPVRPERFAQAVQRSLARTNRIETSSQSRNGMQGSKLRVKSKGGFIFLKYEELVWVEAQGNYLDLHCVDRVYRVREPLSVFYSRLDDRRFIRIHRSIIVNTAYIRELRSWGMGDYVVVLRNAKELPVSRSYREAIDTWVRSSETGIGSETDGPPEMVERSLKSMPA